MSSGQLDNEFLRVGYIYVLQDPISHEIRYVGRTVCTLKSRLYGHIKSPKYYRNKRPRRVIWIAKMMRRGTPPIIAPVQVLPVSCLDSAEEYWIAYFRSLGCKLVNGNNGGRQTADWRGVPTHSGISMSLEMREQIGSKLRGIKRSPATIERMKQAQKINSIKKSMSLRRQWANGPRIEAIARTADPDDVYCRNCGGGPYKNLHGTLVHVSQMHKSTRSI